MPRPDEATPAEQVVLWVSGMTCRHCARAVSARLTDVAGVVAVEADVTSSTVRVHGSARVDELLAVVADAGHQAVEQAGPSGEETPAMSQTSGNETATVGTLPIRTADPLRDAWTGELAEAHAARRRRDLDGEWTHLQRAHVLSQPMVLPHVRTHLAMASHAIRRRDRHELAGQLLRLLLAGPGSLTGRYPAGNTGGADVSPFLPMPIPDDLRALLERHTASEAPR